MCMVPATALPFVNLNWAVHYGPHIPLSYPLCDKLSVSFSSMHLVAQLDFADIMYPALPSVVQLCFLIYMLVSLIILLDIFPLSTLCLVHCFKHGSAVLRHSATEYQTLFLSLVFPTSWWGLCFYVN
jgi:hypothetical protein